MVLIQTGIRQQERESSTERKEMRDGDNQGGKNNTRVVKRLDGGIVEVGLTGSWFDFLSEYSYHGQE